MKRKKFFKKRKNDAVYLLAVLGLRIGQILPRPIGLRVFGLLGRLFFLIPTVDRRRVIKNLSRVFGDRWPEEKIWSVARKSYANLGKNLFDALYLSNLSWNRIRRFVTTDREFERVQAAYARKKGVLIITAHVGCYEMLLHYWAKSGMKCFAIGQKIYDERLDSIVRAARSGENIEYMYRTENPRAMIRLLSQGKVFGVLVDQDTRTDGVFARFLGHLAYTPSAPVKLALKYDIPAFVVTTTRQPDNTHRIFIHELVLERTGDARKDIVLNVQKTNDVISRAIETYPDQWVWMHRRWRRTQRHYPQALSISNYEA